MVARLGAAPPEDVRDEPVSPASPILVATEGAGDLELIKSLLRPEFQDVTGVTGQTPSVAAFEKVLPKVLILAFDALEQVGQYYQDLCRRSTVMQSLPHKTIVLCTKDELKAAYKRCRDREFDDYVLFWPMAQDAQRLLMAVHHALRQLEAEAPVAPTVTPAVAPPTAVAVASHGRQPIATQGRSADHPVPPLVGDAARRDRPAPGHASPTEAARHALSIETARHALEQADKNIGTALNHFSYRLNEGDLRELVVVQNAAGFLDAFDDLHKSEIGEQLQNVADVVAPGLALAGGRAQNPRQPAAIAFRPVVLIVDEDVFQQHILRALLQGENMDLTFELTGAGSLVALNRHYPDLILMDVELPDGSGIEFTRRIKAMAKFAHVPIVMITGHVDKDLIVNCVAAGAAGVVVKPFKKEVVLAKIRDCLGRETKPVAP